MPFNDKNHLPAGYETMPELSAGVLKVVEKEKHILILCSAHSFQYFLPIQRSLYKACLRGNAAPQH